MAKGSVGVDIAYWMRRHDVAVWTVGGVVGLIVLITWLGHEHASPIQAAQTRAREVLSQPDLTVEQATVHRDGRRGKLVCGLIDGDPARPVAAEVRRPMPMNAPMEFLSYRVRRLATPGARRLDYEEVSLLRRCARRSAGAVVL